MYSVLCTINCENVAHEQKHIHLRKDVTLMAHHLPRGLRPPKCWVLAYIFSLLCHILPFSRPQIHLILPTCKQNQVTEEFKNQYIFKSFWPLYQSNFRKYINTTRVYHASSYKLLQFDQPLCALPMCLHKTIEGFPSIEAIHIHTYMV